jgi:hypothetical protein
VLDCLLSGTRQVIGKHPHGRTVAAGVVPGFMPKHNSEPIAAGGSTGFDATLSRLANLRCGELPRPETYSRVDGYFLESVSGAAGGQHAQAPVGRPFWVVSIR